MKALSHILVATDFSESAGRALDAAIALAEKFGSKITLMHSSVLPSAAYAAYADLVVVGTHGRQGLPRYLLGSVAEKVVRLSPVPVLTVGEPHDAKAAAQPIPATPATP